MIVRLSLRGDVICVSHDTLAKYPDTLLGAAVNSGMNVADSVKTSSGEDAFFFDRDACLFRRVILSFYTYGFWQWLPTDNPMTIYSELCFWGLAPVSLPRVGQDVGGYATFLGFALCGCVGEEVFAVPERNISTMPHPYKSHFCRVAETLIVNSDPVRSTALRFGVYLDVGRVEGVHTKEVSRWSSYPRYFINSYPVFELDNLRGDSELVAEVGPSELLSTASPDHHLKWRKSILFEYQGFDCSITVDCTLNGRWDINVTFGDYNSDTFSWPYDFCIDIRVGADDKVTSDEWEKWGHEVHQSNTGKDTERSYSADEVRKLFGDDDRFYALLYLGTQGEVTDLLGRCGDAPRYLDECEGRLTRAVTIKAYKLV